MTVALSRPRTWTSGWLPLAMRRQVEQAPHGRDGARQSSAAANVFAAARGPSRSSPSKT